jgi:hypothetical protein
MSQYQLVIALQVIAIVGILTFGVVLLRALRRIGRRMEREASERLRQKASNLFVQLRRALYKEMNYTSQRPFYNEMRIVSDSGATVTIRVDTDRDSSSEGQYVAYLGAGPCIYGCADDLRSFAKQIGEVCGGKKANNQIPKEG